MNRAWCTETTDLVYLDEAYDLTAASDGRSRYGAYLRDCGYPFAGDDLDPPDPVTFAVLAWETACPPVMSPGYVRRRGDVHAVRAAQHTEDPDVLLAFVEVRLPHSVLHARPGRLLRDWTTGPHRHSEGPALLRAPLAERGPALLLGARSACRGRGVPA